VKIAFHFHANQRGPAAGILDRFNGRRLIMDEIARRLARSHEVIAYCLRGEGLSVVQP
jgi:hypothetical protein